MMRARPYQPGALGNSRPGATRSRIMKEAAENTISSEVRATVVMADSLMWGPDAPGSEPPGRAGPPRQQHRSLGRVDDTYVLFQGRDQLAAFADAEPLIDAAEMVSHGMFGDAEARGDGLVRQSQ